MQWKPLGIDIDCLLLIHLISWLFYGFLIKDVFARLVVVKRGFTCYSAPWCKKSQKNNLKLSQWLDLLARRSLLLVEGVEFPEMGAQGLHKAAVVPFQSYGRCIGYHPLPVYME